MVGETIVILGIPLDNLTMDEAVDRIFDMVEAYRLDKRSRQVATVNVDFVVNTLTWRLGHTRHPELLDILQRADLVTADGMPLVVISRLLGSPLKARVTGADLVPRLAAEAARRGKSLYFLGGRGEVTRKAASLLQERYPELELAGIDSPFVFTEGENLADADEVDLEIIQRINAAHPDILLIAFGNPKQEVWFNRNRRQLEVPVSIGIGGTFEFIAGSVRRAPLWVQRAGLEWIFRITQDPGRLWKRYLVGFFKFGLMVWPAILHYHYQRLVFRWLRSRKVLTPEGSGPIAATTAGALSVLTLPGRLDLVSLDDFSAQVDQAFNQSANLILDFGSVAFIDSTGLGYLIRTLRRAEREGYGFCLVRIPSNVRRFFELNRTWELFRERSHEDLDEALASLDEQRRLPPFYYLTVQQPDFVRLDLFGRLDAQQMASLDMASLTNALRDRNCIIHLRQLKFVDSSGLIFFFKIQRLLVGAGMVCVLCGMTDNVKQLFHITRINRLFRIEPDLASARQTLERSE